MQSMVTGVGVVTTGGDAAGNVSALVSGGAALIRHFGRIPDFDGDRILKFILDHDRYSVLRVHAQVAAGDVDGVPSPERHDAAVFVLGEMVDLRLDEFQAWSQLDRLILRRAPDRPVRAEHTGPRPASSDVETELIPHWGARSPIRHRPGLFAIAGSPRPQVATQGRAGRAAREPVDSLRTRRGKDRGGLWPPGVFRAWR